MPTAILTGLAPDGGLYVPEAWPTLDVAGETFSEVAADVVTLEAVELSAYRNGEEVVVCGKDGTAREAAAKKGSEGGLSPA